MAEYVVQIRNSKAITKSGEALTIDTVLKQILEVGGEIIDDGNEESALFDCEGPLPDLYRTLEYDPNEVLISSVANYEIPDPKKKIKCG